MVIPLLANQDLTPILQQPTQNKVYSNSKSEVLLELYPETGKSIEIRVWFTFIALA